jgi:CHAT domain-containing protein
VEALKITEKTLGKDHPDYATTLHNLAMLYQRKGKYLEAETLFKEDMQIIEKTLGKSHPDYASSLNNLGSLYHAMGENQKAQTFFLQAIEIREKTLGKPHPHYGFSLGNLADLYKSQGEYRKAQPLLIDLNQSMLDGIDKVFPVLSEREKGQFYKTFSARFESFNSFVLLQQKHNPGIIAEMFNNQLATKACLFHATAKVRQHILESPDETLKRLYQQWLDKKNYLAKIYQLSKEEKQKQAIDENKLEEEANALEKQLSLQSELFAINTDKTRYNWQDVQKQLKASEACLEMVRFRWFNQTWTDTIYYAALLVTHVSKLPELILLENGNDLEGRYARFYENAIRKGLLAKGIGNVRVDSLYHHYWGKIAPFLKKAGVEKVYFSPDGVYNRINLNTLYNPLTGKYILDEIDIQLLTNTKDLVTRKSKANTINNASLFGYPDYNQANDKGPKGVVSTPYFSTESMKRTLKDGTLGMLKGTEREVNSIAFLLAKNQIKVDKFLEKEASEEALKNVHNPSILHIATHGFFITEAEIRKGSSDSTPANNTSLENPLFHSGLYLAGAQQSLDGKVKDDLSEDGILTAYEAMNLNLDQTDLVVLSACETGLGEIKNGEGVYGLQRALQTAGAKAVLMSLWKVDDTATGELMRLFYERWLQLDNKREAFKMAQLSIRARYADPYYWGAFVLVGE